MKLTHLSITNLYGYFNKEIPFFEDFSILVGINGSGKTSILNIINWMVSPSLPHLCVTDFKKIVLSIKFENVDYTLVAEHQGLQLIYSVIQGSKKLHPLQVQLKRLPNKIKTNDQKIELADSYTGLAPDQEEEETWKLISKFPNPVLIGLDRNIFTEEAPGQIFYESNESRYLRKKFKDHKQPLDRVNEMVNKEYRKRKNAILELTNRLKHTLMLSSFEGNLSRENLILNTPVKLKIQEIDQAEERINNYLVNFEKRNVNKKENQILTEYFTGLKKITKDYQEDPEDELTNILYSLNANHFKKVRKLLKEFEKFEAASESEMQIIKTFLDTLNLFFKDSAKKVAFKEDTSELVYHILNEKGKEVVRNLDLCNLSSGERQILILFSYIAFNSQDGKLFIIDEPELSLHIKWQDDFLEKLSNITPKSTQVILATHSPILANKKKENAIVLLPYNINH